MNNEIIRLPDVMREVQLSKPTIYRLMQEGKFPKQRRIGVRAVGWVRSELDLWKESLEIVT